MKTFFTLMAALLFSTLAMSQTIEISSPALSPPYEVAPGTEVTFTWDHFGSEPTSIYTHNQEPEFPDFGPDPEWTQHSGYVDNGDGTFSFTLTIDEETWILGGYYQSFLGMWTFSNVIHISIASEVEITYQDGLVCPDGSIAETLTVSESYDSYQWYHNDQPIDGATDQMYEATLPGAYKVQVPLDGTPTFSNTLTLHPMEVSISGTFDEQADEITVHATPDFDGYQWLLAADGEEPTPIDGATAASYTTALPDAPHWISAEATKDGCTVQSEAKMLFDDHFTAPVIEVSADTNSFGNVCVNTDVVLSVGDQYGEYFWTQDGFEVYGPSNSISISQSYQAGSYQVTVTPQDWPEIELTSESVDISFFTVLQPGLVTNVSGPYCPGQEIIVTLGDEGYDYTWYMHTDFDYTEDDIVEAQGTSFTFEFEENVRITVVAEYQGCTSSRTINLNSIANNSPYISLTNYDQQYLCTDSTAYISVSEWAQSDYTNYQWYVMTDGELQAIEGETTPMYAATETGIYAVKANPVGCLELELTSNEVEIHSYTDRTLSIYIDNDAICDGESTNLNVSGGTWSWQNIQWFEGDIQMGAQGYEELFLPIPGGGSGETQEVSEFNGYLAKARHVSCPTGEKLTSNIVRLKPLLNPTVSVDPDYGVNNYHLAAYDSIPSYLYCPDQMVEMSVPDEYAEYEWYVKQYSGDGNYELGTPLEGAEGPTASFLTSTADWITVQVTDDNGCVGYSTPIILDTYVFSPVTITSYSNAELCGPNDSTLLHVSFPGNYAWVEWFLDGELIPGANNDTIWADQPGEYTVTVYREECPDVSISSGVGPYVSYLNAWIEELEDMIYAMPQYGFYDYQWYLDGEPLENNTSTPWILYKDEMAEGVYTVDVSNPDSCVATSSPYIWEPTSTRNHLAESLSVYPNPTRGIVYVQGYENLKNAAVLVRDMSGKQVYRSDLLGSSIDLSTLKEGAYLIEIHNDGVLIKTEKLLMY